jgi:hypothetical protein
MNDMNSTIQNEGMQATTKRKVALGITAGILIVAFIIAGTLAWTSFSQNAINDMPFDGAPGGRLHDDYDGENKDVYVENFGADPILARVRLDEYMELGIGAGIFNDTTANQAVPFTSSAAIDDSTTWRPHIPIVGDPTTCNHEAENKYHDYFEWTMGGSKTYMPTFQKDSASKVTDISGIAADPKNGGTNLTGSDGTHNYWTVGDTYTANADSGKGNIVSETHTAKDTLNATVVTMAQWVANGRPLGPFWVYDTDGWAYWAQAIEPETSTGLLLDSLKLIGVPNEDWYYSINVVAQFSTIGDWNDGTNGEDKSGFYDPANGAPVKIGSDAEYLLNQASRPSVTSVKITSDPTPEYTVGTTTGLAFTASVQGHFLDGVTDGDKVTWSISAGSGGTINPTTGVFTGATKGGTYTVTATSVYDTGKTATVQLTVIAPPVVPVVTGVTITSGAAPTYGVGQGSLTFTATVQGTNVLGTEKVTWDISDGSGGTINATTGVFSGGTVLGTYTVTATSVDDNTKKASVQLRIITDATVATTRLIPAATAGDTSDWLEIAVYGKYSLMLRRDNIPETISSATESYVGSPQQTGVNSWFAGTSTLAANAPLRSYAMQNDALSNLGTFSGSTSGISSPTPGTIGATGNNVAFLGNFAEYASFCSLMWHDGTPPFPASSTEAQTNFKALNFAHTKVEPSRSPANVGMICAGLFSSNYTYAPANAGIIGGVTSANSTPPYYIRPMLWVDNSAGASLFTSR